MSFYFFDLKYFFQFFGSFYLYLLQKTNDSCNIWLASLISAVFWLVIILDRLLKNGTVLPVWRLGGSYWPTQNKSPSKRPVSESKSWNKIIKTVPSKRTYNCAHVKLFHKIMKTMYTRITIFAYFFAGTLNWQEVRRDIYSIVWMKNWKIGSLKQM